MKKIRWTDWWAKWSNFEQVKNGKIYRRQKDAEEAVEKYNYTFYGGAAGPGKSYFLRKFPIKFLIETYHKTGLKGLRAGLFCEDYPALHDRHLTKIRYEFPEWLGTYHGQQHEFVLDQKYGGGVIAFRNLDDPSKYLSSEFALIEVDELTKNSKETFDFLRLRLRWPGIENPKFIAASNPGGIGHEWVKRIWIDRDFSSDEQQKDQFHYVKALPTDNPNLPDSYYITLSSLPEKLRKAYRDGNWDVFEGQYFSEWDRGQHTVAPFEIPSTWKRFRSYDHGRAKPACCLWGAVDYDGRVWIYREYYPVGQDVNEIAKEINRLSEGETYEYSVADPAIFANIGFVDKYGGQTIAESFARQGVTFIPASNRRIDGWNLMHQYFNWAGDKPPLAIFFNTCLNAIRTIPNLIHDELHPEDLDSDGEDHAADAFRYLLMSLHERKSKKLLNDVEKKLEEMKHTEIITPTNFNDIYYGNR